MILRYFFPLLLLISCYKSTFGSTADSLSVIVKQFETYYKENYQELVYIHTDKQYYLTGERLRFKVYCLDKLNSAPSQLSKVAYVELLDRENSPQLQAKIELIDGVGFGEFFVPTKLNSENFVLRGYTRWMRNFGPESYFHSMLTIINPFKKLGLKSIPNENDVTADFYPESGTMINGVKTKVVFVCKNSDGYPVNFSGKLIANDSLLITQLNPAKNGVGSFEFTPDIFKKYYVELIHSDGSTSKFDLPKISENGLSFHVNEKSRGYGIAIFCNDPSLIDPSDHFFSMIHQKGQILQTKTLTLIDGLSSMEIDKSMIDDGIFTISLFASNGKLLRTRKVLKCSSENSNTAVELSNTKFSRREKVIVDFSEFIQKAAQQNTEISISVTSQHSAMHNHYLNFKNYLLLGNSLFKIVHGFQGIFDSSNVEVSSQINNLLIAYSDEEMVWQQSKQKSEVAFISEYRGELITGKVTNKLSKEPTNGIITYLSIPGKYNKLYAAKSKNDGDLFFEINGVYGNNEIILQNNYTKDSIYVISLDNPFSQEYVEIDIPALKFDDSMKSWISQQSQNMQIENANQRYKPRLPPLTQVDTSSFFDEPDSRYYLDDYTRFVVMEEVMREYVAGVNVRKNREGFHFMVVDSDRNIAYEDNPLMLLDGVPIFDANEIINLNPLKVEKIETINRWFIKGDLDCRGIVSYTTYYGNLDGYTMHKNAYVMDYEGIQTRKQSFFPSYSSSFEKRIKTPDFRNILYWNPQINTDKTNNSLVEFYTSDYIGDYEVRIEGLDKDGNVYSVKKFLKVDIAPIK